VSARRGQAPWYADGLRFACTRCGNCCTGEPGFTWVSAAEAEALAARLGLDVAAFQRRYTREAVRDGRRLRALNESAQGACVFWRADAGCTVYRDRPRQCRTWPFWRSNLADGAAWEAAARDCPGIGQGPLQAAADISATAADDGLP
jgi:Fe-S-cluster containining protein